MAKVSQGSRDRTVVALYFVMIISLLRHWTTHVFLKGQKISNHSIKSDLYWGNFITKVISDHLSEKNSKNHFIPFHSNTFFIFFILLSLNFIPPTIISLDLDFISPTIILLGLDFVPPAFILLGLDFIHQPLFYSIGVLFHQPIILLNLNFIPSTFILLGLGFIPQIIISLGLDFIPPTFILLGLNFIPPTDFCWVRILSHRPFR